MARETAAAEQQGSRAESMERSKSEKLRAMIDERFEFVYGSLGTSQGEINDLDNLPVYIERRKKALLGIMDRVREDYGHLPFELSVEEPVINLEVFNVWSYNTLDGSSDIEIAAALWILDHARMSNTLYELAEMLVENCVYPECYYTPSGFSTPLYSKDLIEAVIQALKKRHDDPHCLNREVMEGRKPNEVFLKMMEFLPGEDVEHACQVFREKLWEYLGIALGSISWYDTRIQMIREQLDAMDEDKEDGFSLPDLGSIHPREAKTLAGLLAAGPGKETWQTQGLWEEIDEYDRKKRCISMAMADYLQKDRKTIIKHTGSREIAELFQSFRIDDPFEICFALIYLLETGDDAPWLNASGCGLIINTLSMLPWSKVIDETTDEEGDTWHKPLCYGNANWEKEWLPEQAMDLLHTKHGDMNLAQIFFNMCQSVFPVGKYPLEADRKKLIEEGMDELTALRLTDMAGLLLLQNFQTDIINARYVGDSDWSEDTTAQEEESPEEGEKETAGAENNGADETGGKEKEAYAEELKKAKAEIKALRAALSSQNKEFDTERRRYEQELEPLRQEHRELADLRELVFNRENEVQETPSRQIAYPYETRKRTVVFGGHDSFLRAIRPMLPNVRFVEAGQLAFDPNLIRYADVVWIQTNCISHSQYLNIVHMTRHLKIQMRYFAYASAERCAEQLVIEDER